MAVELATQTQGFPHLQRLGKTPPHIWALCECPSQGMMNEKESVLRADDDGMTCNRPGQLVMYGNRKIGKYMARPSLRNAQ